jgi:hypothetical protein
MGIAAALCGVSEVKGECERLFAIMALGVKEKVTSQCYLIVFA